MSGYVPDYGGAVTLEFRSMPTFVPDYGGSVVLEFDTEEPVLQIVLTPWYSLLGLLPQ